MTKKILSFVVLVVSLMFIGVISANATTVTYQTFEVGDKIKYNAEENYVCNYIGDGCLEYSVTEDNGETIKITNQIDEITVDKNEIVNALVVISDSKIDLPFNIEDENYNFDPNTEGYIEIHLFLSDFIGKAVDYANDRSSEDGVYANVYYDGYVFFIGEDTANNENLTIGEDTTLSVLGYDGEEIINNGTVKISELAGGGISGDGTLILVFSEENDEESSLLSVTHLAGNKVELRNVKSYDKALIFLTADDEDATAVFNYINKNVKVDGYKMILEKKEVAEEGYGFTYYQIRFVKEEANPKTVDSIFVIITILVLSLLSSIIISHKIKNNN